MAGKPLKVMETAILVDGAFYLKRAKSLFGEATPQERADELEEYCRKHIAKHGDRHLYRVFFYDCPPSDAVVWNPIAKKNVPLAKTKLYAWANEFHGALVYKRKFALRMGELLETQGGYTLKPDSLKKLMSGTKALEELDDRDLQLDIRQKGVDMKMGLDVASLAHGGIVNQIIMIAGDSDFVPAAKMARREGIDFILDPMWHTISKSLNEHIDGIESCCRKPESARSGQRQPDKKKSR